MLNPEEVREKRALKLFAKGFHSTRKASEGVFLADTKRLLFKVEQTKDGACCELQAVFLFSTVFFKINFSLNDIHETVLGHFPP